MLHRKHTRRRFSRPTMSVSAGNEKFWMEANQIGNLPMMGSRQPTSGYKPVFTNKKGRGTGFRTRTPAMTTFRHASIGGPMVSSLPSKTKDNVVSNTNLWRFFGVYGWTTCMILLSKFKPHKSGSHQSILDWQFLQTYCYRIIWSYFPPSISPTTSSY